MPRFRFLRRLRIDSDFPIDRDLLEGVEGGEVAIGGTAAMGALRAAVPAVGIWPELRCGVEMATILGIVPL